MRGTDQGSGCALHRELEVYNESGIPAAEVLRMATPTAAQVMKRDNELGSIAPGKLADMILVDGDPTTNISDTDWTRLLTRAHDERALVQTTYSNSRTLSIP